MRFYNSYAINTKDEFGQCKKIWGIFDLSLFYLGLVFLCFYHTEISILEKHAGQFFQVNLEFGLQFLVALFNFIKLSSVILQGQFMWILGPF